MKSWWKRLAAVVLAGSFVLGAGLLATRFRSPVPGPAAGTYAGSESCRACHEEAFAAWSKSHHGLAERSLRADLDTRAFEPPGTFSHGAQSTEIRRTNGQPMVVTTGLGGRRETYRVERVIGHDPLRQFLVSAAGGRLQTLEAAYDPRTNQWFNVFGNEDRQPGEWGHWTGRGMNWNSMCASCHNTRLLKNYDPAADAYHTTMAEMSVGCEACHGPLQAHNDWQKKSGKSGRKDPTLRKLTAKQTVDNCGSCHARRSELTGQFQPGEDFNDHFRLLTVDLSEAFYPDGQIHEEDYEFAPFLGSRMHARGVVCGDCHQPHSMKTRLPGNFLCLRCHGGGVTNAPVINPVTHSRHRVFGYDAGGVLTNADLARYPASGVKETGGECVNCHMPQTVFMQRHARHDHGFTIPDPLLTQQFNAPNACNKCHTDKSTDWALDAVGKWYGDKMNRPSRVRAQTIARARNGDVGSTAGLVSILQHDEIPYWRAVAARLLEAHADETGASAALFTALADPDPLVREACVDALQPLVKAGQARAVEAISPRLADPDRNVRIAAAWALGARLENNSPAAKDLVRMLDFNADQPAGQFQYGSYYFERGDLGRAREHLQTAVSWDGFSAPLRQQLAVVLSALGRTPEAVAQLEIACRNFPRDAGVHFSLALALNDQGDPARARKELETAVQLDSRFARAWYNLGLLQDGAGESPAAIESLVRAETADPSDARIPYARATILARLGRIKEARTVLGRVLELQPNDADARQLLDTLQQQPQ